ncbi:MAG: hypothetical protein WC002_09855 [Candidatus Muiribacteriota bacterium]
MKNFIERFGKIFLFLFLLDGLVSFTDDINGLIYGQSFISIIRNDIGFFVFANAFFLYFITIFFNILPKKYFVPVTLFCLIAPLFLSIGLINAYTSPVIEPVRILNINHHVLLNKVKWFGFFTLMISITQILLGLWAWLKFSKYEFDEKRETFELKPFIINGVLTIVLLIILLPLLLVNSIGFTVNNLTNGFIQTDFSKLYSNEKIYEKDGKTVQLIGMIHIGAKDFYHNILKSIDKDNTIVLAEGISDKNNLLKIKPTYVQLSKTLNLETQAENFALDQSKYDIIVADIDVSEFSEHTIHIVNSVLDMLENTSSAGEFLTKYQELDSYMRKPGMIDRFYNDILHKRNETILNHLDNAIEKYDNIVIPWGAYHLDEIEKDLIANGFRLTDRTKRTALKYRKN